MLLGHILDKRNSVAAASFFPLLIYIQRKIFCTRLILTLPTHLGGKIMQQSINSPKDQNIAERGFMMI